MKQLLILSGKGGTGKTTIAGAFIKLTDARAYADCDVDAPNLHLIMNWPSPAKRSDFLGMGKAVIDAEMCSDCGLCMQHCRFDAIVSDDGHKVDYYACEGCGVCKAICPTGAVSLRTDVAGELMLYTGDSVFSTARLKMGSGTSGKLVTEVKKRMESAAKEAELAIIDGSPGIGCPVIASLSGVDMVLIVAEPSLSGISDMERILDTAGKFQVLSAVCVNKYDTNIDNTQEIESICRQKGLPFVGRIPYDPEAIKAVNNGYSIVDIDCAAGRAVKEIFKKTMQILNR
jgi:MinD superfamily P-loop ATPase